MIKNIIFLLSGLFFLGCGTATTGDGISNLIEEENTATEIKNPQTKIEPEQEPQPKQNTIPTASIADKPVEQLIIKEGIFVNFQAIAEDEDGDTLSYLWKENDLILATTKTFKKNDFSEGEHTITLLVTDSHGASVTDTQTIKIIKANTQNIAPSVNAGKDVKLKITNSTWLSATAEDSDGTIKSYNWSEDGKQLSDEVSFSYIPQTIGKHTLKITVTDNDNSSTSDALIVDVDNKLPLIIIRIEFDNYTFHSNAQTWSDKIFGTDEGELNHFYNENSHGKLQFEKAVETQGTKNDGIITVQLPKNHPGNSHDEIYKEAIALADSYIDFSQYDTDNNQAISLKELQIMFLVAGGENATGLYPGVWAHATSFYEGLTLDGVKVMDNQMHGTYSTFGESHFNHGENASIGIIAHELGHAALGLPDLYDTDGGSQGIGNFGLMGAGNWGQKNYDERPGTTPIPMLAWSKIQAKFVEPIEVKQDQSIVLLETKDKNFKPYLIKTTHDKEYFLLENRANSGYDRGLFMLKEGDNFQGGLLITHIDDNINNNQNPQHKKVDIEEANNAGLDTNTSHRGHINNLYFSGNKNSFTPLTSPNSNLYSGDESGLNITNISDSGQTMSADIELRR